MQKNLYLGNLNATRDWGHAKDYVEAQWLMLQQQESDDYVIATNKLHTLRYLLEVAFSNVGISDYEMYIKVNPKFIRVNEIHNLKGDYSKIKNKLGWQPKTSFEDMIKIMVNNDLKLIQ